MDDATFVDLLSSFTGKHKQKGFTIDTTDEIHEYFMSWLNRYLEISQEHRTFFYKDERYILCPISGTIKDNVEDDKPRGGRPRYPEDEWVRQEVFRYSRNRKELYNEWLKKAKANGREFADSRESYRRVFDLKPEETEETE